MSTKTTIKRIALVAVASLGLGVLATAPSQAAAPSYTVSAYATTPVNGVSATAATAIAGPANYVAIANTDGALSEYITVSGGTFTDGTVAKTIAAAGTVYVSTPTAGTITATVTQIAANGVADVANAATLTITVAASIAGTVYASTTVTEATSGVAADVVKYTNSATSAVTRLARAASTGAVFSYTLSQVDANSTPLLAANTKSVAATLSGVGSLSIGAGACAGTATAPYVVAPAASANSQVVCVYADGRAGKSTLSIAVNGAVVKTYEITFWGSVASYTATVNNSYLKAGAAAYATAVSVTAKDANGVVVPAATIYGSSSATTVGVTASVATTGYVSSTPSDAQFAAAGKAVFAVDPSLASAGTKSTLTFGNAATSATVSTTAAVNVSGAQIANLTWAFAETGYLAGQEVTINFTASDASGSPVGDGSYNVFAAVPTSNYSANGFAPTTAITFASGKASWTFYAPIVTSAALEISGTLATDVSLATALQGAAVKVSTNIGDTAALDAANEATDAANAATDAANAAAEAADAATAAAQDAQAAVAELATQVAALIAGIKAQITTLTNLVIKIQKKVKA